MSLRILIAVTHLLGAGHLTRAAALARALAARGHAVTLASGGMPTPLVSTAGVALVQLPPVRTEVGSFTRLLDEAGRPVTAGRLSARRAQLAGLAGAIRPDAVLTEHFPFGRRVLAAEFEAVIDAARETRSPPLVLASIRDVLVAPSRPERIAAAHQRIRRDYDAVLVHGDPTLLPLEASWPVDETLRQRLIYTGYISATPAEPRGPTTAGTGYVLVSGGSSAAALPLYRAAIAAAASMPERRWHMLVGAGVPADETAALTAAAPSNMHVEPARPDFARLLAQAAVFVGQAGYNTVMDVVGARLRSVLVPFEEGGETEQRVRAEALAARALATTLPPGSLSGPRLAAAIREVDATAPPAPEGLRLDGAGASARVIERLAANRLAGRDAAPVRLGAS